jgi:hypothetical protein
VRSDIDCDGDVDLRDLEILLRSFGHVDIPARNQPCPDIDSPEAGDLDGNGSVDLRDLAELLRDLGDVPRTLPDGLGDVGDPYLPADGR